MANGKENSLIYAFAVGVPALIEFHTYSSYLSSPWTTGKLAKSADDIDHFWFLFTEATAASLIFSGIVGAILSHGFGSPYPFIVAIITAIAVSAWMYYDYYTAIYG